MGIKTFGCAVFIDGRDWFTTVGVNTSDLVIFEQAAAIFSYLPGAQRRAMGGSGDGPRHLVMV